MEDLGWEIINNVPRLKTGISTIAPPEILKAVCCSCSTETPCARKSCSCVNEQLSRTSYCKCVANKFFNPNTIHMDDEEEIDDEEIEEN